MMKNFLMNEGLQSVDIQHYKQLEGYKYDLLFSTSIITSTEHIVGV